MITEDLMIHGTPAGRAVRVRRVPSPRFHPAKRSRVPSPPACAYQDHPEDDEAAETPVFPLPPGWTSPFRVSPQRRIEWDTPIVPELMAGGVCEEVSAWFASPTRLPERWVHELAGYANTIYAHNERFRRRVRGRGDRGRDYLLVFMRHWLAAMLKQRRPEWYARLPSDYGVGRDLPERHPKSAD
jgi:hypothetical protein